MERLAEQARRGANKGGGGEPRPACSSPDYCSTNPKTNSRWSMPKGDPHDVRRVDIDEWGTHTRSHMPEGLGANLTPQQMADLLAFLAVRR